MKSCKKLRNVQTRSTGKRDIKDYWKVARQKMIFCFVDAVSVESIWEFRGVRTDFLKSFNFGREIDRG